MNTIDLGQEQAYERDIQSLVSAMQENIEIIVRVSQDDNKDLSHVLQEFMPLSKELAREEEKDRSGLAEEGKGISEIIHLLGEHGIFRKTLLDHIIILKNLSKQLSDFLKEAYSGDLVSAFKPATQRSITHIAEKISDEIKEIIERLNKAKRLFGKMCLIASDLKQDTKWNEFINQLSREHPNILTHRTAMMTSFHGSEAILKAITQQFILLEKQCRTSLEEIQKSIEQIQKGNLPKESLRPERMIETFSILLASVEQPIYHDLLPRLYTFQRIENGRKKIIALEGDLRTALMQVYKKLGAIATNSQ